MRTRPQRPILFLRAPDTSAIAAQGKGAPAHGIPRRLRGGSGAHAPAAPPPYGAPDGPCAHARSAALPKSPFGRRARGFFFFFAVSSLLCFLLYPLFFENIRRPPLASKFVGRSLRTPLAAPRLPASLPSAPLVPRPAPAPHPAPPAPHPAPPLSPPRTSPLPTPACPTPALPRLFHPRRTKWAHASFPLRAPFFLSVQNPVPCPARSSAGLFPGLKTGVSRSRRRCRARSLPA